MQRATITAKGKVQRTGYRDYVLDLAIELGVVGYVENQLDENVLIIGEAERDVLEDFIRKLKPEDDPLINVDKTDIRYEKPTGEFKYFEIRRGSSDEESGERLDTAQKALKVLIKTTAGMNIDLGNKIDNVADKQDQTIDLQKQTIDEVKTVGVKVDNVAEKIDSGFAKTDENFMTLRQDYGRISKDIAMAVKGIEKVVQNTEKLLEKSERDRAGFEKSMDKVANAILALAKSKYLLRKS